MLVFRTPLPLAPSDHPQSRPTTMHSSDSADAQLEKLTREMVTAINDQNLDPRSAPWDSAAPDFTAEVAWTTTPNKVPLSDYLAALSKVRSAAPKGRLHIVEISASSRRGIGTVFVHSEWHDTPPGVVRPTVALYDFIFTGSEWKCTRYRCLPGINPRAGMAAILAST